MSLTSTGFERPRLVEIKSDYDQRFIDALGPVNTNPDAVVGQIIGIFSAALDDAYEAIQNTYDSMYPFSAEGVSLDGAVSFVGMERLAAAPTTITAICYGVEGTLIPAGSLMRSIDNKQYAANADTVISRSAAGDVEVTIDTVTNSANYQIIAGGVSYVYTSDSSATSWEIASGLAALFNVNDFTATANGGVLRLISADGYTDFTITVDGKMSVSKLGTPVNFTAVEVGAHVLPVGSLNKVDSSIIGLDNVYNLIAGSTGRDVETDEELRQRHLDGVRATGSATAAAIRARTLAEVDSVTYCRIYENRTNTIDGLGLPPHSFEAVVSGGDDQSVANKLFELKPAGIETYGNTSIQVLDENGDLQEVNFSRSTDKYAWVRVSVNLLYNEETLTSSIADAIKDAVIAYGIGIGIGEDIINQRMYGPIYSATTGIGSITVEAALTSSVLDTPAYTSSNVGVGRAELAVFDRSRITVVGV